MPKDYISFCISVFNSQSTNNDSIDAWTPVKSYIYFLYKFIESCEITVEMFAGTVALCAGAPFVRTKLPNPLATQCASLIQIMCAIVCHCRCALPFPLCARASRSQRGEVRPWISHLMSIYKKLQRRGCQVVAPTDACTQCKNLALQNSLVNHTGNEKYYFFLLPLCVWLLFSIMCTYFINGFRILFHCVITFAVITNYG